jgi:hypothetical protein
MCDAKTPGAGARLTTPSGEVYYPDSAAGRAAMKADMDKTMGPGNGEEGHPPPGDQPPTDLTDCSTYTDAQWDTGCSKYFKFSQMKNKPNSSGGQLSPEVVACNWQKLCQNILDPIKAQFPGMSISSGYRPGPGHSDHGLGKAADIQLLSGDAVAGAKEMFKWIGSQGLPFSQIIFEGRWVHVAYNGPSVASVAVLVTRTGTAPYQNGGGRSGSALPPDLKWA